VFLHEVVFTSVCGQLTVFQATHKEKGNARHNHRNWYNNDE